MRKEFAIVYILFFLGACSPYQLYIVRTFDSDLPWETIAISKNAPDSVMMLQLFRNDTDFVSNVTTLIKSEKGQYLANDGEILIELRKSVAYLKKNDNNIVLPKIRKSPNASTKEVVEELLESNYIVHANIHQLTYFDCRDDSYCYLIKNEDHAPYDSNKWYLVEFSGELFLSYSGSQRVFYRVYADNGGLVFTSSTGPKETKFHRADLRIKRKNTL